MPLVIHITTVPDSLIFLSGQPRFLKSLGVDVAAISSPGEALTRFGVEEGIPVYPLPMPRRITPRQDLQSLAHLIGTLRDLRPDVVHAHTPKGGLLGMLAARASDVPVRLYHMRGLPYVTARGWRRTLLRTTERISCELATRVLCQSPSLRDEAVREGLCADDRIEVPGLGSNGVDAAGRFNPDRWSAEVRARIRFDLCIPHDALVIGYVGRLVRDKGIIDLFKAWSSLRTAFPSAHLLVVGPFEEGDAVPNDTRAALEADERVHLAGFVRDTERMYSVMDVVALPSHREGFPNVPLEAAAMGLPVVSTRVPGCVDAVVDGQTGTLVPAGDPAGLTGALALYLRDEPLRRMHGVAGRDRVLVSFRRERIQQLIADIYFRELGISRTPPESVPGAEVSR